MSLQNAIDRFPRQVPGPGGKEYRRLDGYYAVHGVKGGSGGHDVVAALANGSIRVHKRDTSADLPLDTTVIAVYAQEQGPMAVPTGEVFVRFAEGVRAEERREELRNAAYDIIRIPPYAPQTAWVRARGGDVADALRNIGELRAVPTVENVEAQMLMEMTRR